MAVIEKNDEKIEEKLKEFKYLIRPTHYMNYDAESKKWELEIHLPGINKENIEFKLLNDKYFLKATRDQAIYSVNENFPFEIKIDSVKGEYKDGLLKVNGDILDPLKVRLR